MKTISNSKIQKCNWVLEENKGVIDFQLQGENFHNTP